VPAPHCCPRDWDMYACRDTDDPVSKGLNCHNPVLACPLSLICGQGCDFEVTGRCPVCDPIICPLGERFDSTLCRCVPPPCLTASGAPIVCPAGGALDAALCRCFPLPVAQ
jgi:hypothetical protein